MGYTFISYSRKQLYFAESIALNLQQSGIETWIDIQQLTIGENWKSKLQGGYKNCKNLILIASEAAFASPYVEVEWRSALEDGREIVLVVVENVKIPEILQGCAVFDFRTNYPTQIHQLTDYLAGEVDPRQDKIPHSNNFPFPLHIPIVIWVAIATQTMPFLLAFLLSMLFVSSGNYWTLVISLFGGVFMFATFTRRFWNHELNYRTLQNVSIATLILHVTVLFTAFIIGFLEIVSEGPSVGTVAVFIILFLFGILSIITNIIFHSVHLKSSGNLLRWFSSGQVTQKFRMSAHGKLLNKNGLVLRENTLPKPTPVSYYLLYDPADKNIARRISENLDKVGHVQVSDYEQARAHLVIVTNYTSRKILQWAGETFSGSAIYLLGSPVNSIDNIGPASNVQWVDIRENEKKIMEILANGLSDLAAWQREYAFASSPKKFEAFHVPISIEILRFIGYLDTGGLFAYSLKSFTLGYLYSAILATISGATLLLLMNRFSNRRLPGLLTFLGLLGIPFFHPFLQIILKVPTFPILWGERLIIQLVAFFIGYRWLPSHSISESEKDALGMDSERKIRRWGYVMVATFFVINALLSFGFIQ